jgi:hypothetical protein
MTSRNDKFRWPMDRLKDAFLDDIITMSEEELLAEAREAGIDPVRHGAEMRAKFEHSLLVSDKARMAAAREGVARGRLSDSSGLKGRDVDMANARARLRAAIDRGASLGLTIAARNESELSDSDVLSQLDDLIELGIIPSEDEKD